MIVIVYPSNIDCTMYCEINNLLLFILNCSLSASLHSYLFYLISFVQVHSINIKYKVIIIIIIILKYSKYNVVIISNKLYFFFH